MFTHVSPDELDRFAEYLYTLGIPPLPFTVMYLYDTDSYGFVSVFVN